MIFTWCESVLVIEREEFCGGIGLFGTWIGSHAEYDRLV